VVTGHALPVDAAELAISHASGETDGAVCVVTGDVLSPSLLDILIQARVAGVLFYHAEGYDEVTLKTLKDLPFFVGCYTEPEGVQALQPAGVRHG
jgi:hypothetical protein